MAIVLSLVSALAYGVSDFLGGIFSKRVSPWQVAVVGQTSSGVLSLVAALVVSGSPTGHDLAFGALAGLGGGFGAAFLYRGLSTARMGVVAPLSAIGTALIPVVVGVVTGDRPSTTVVVGIVLAFPAIALISRVADAEPGHRGGVVDGTLAGVGFGLLFVFLGQIGDDAGLMPLAMSQLTSIVSVVVTAMVLRQAWMPRSRADWSAVVMGPLGATAQGAFLYASQHGLLSVVSVISSLYPASTVVLAAVVLREKILRWQAVGLLTAAAAVALVAAG
ncbi:DMT family transporter [Aeromicrobium fastidiosum]|uniref:DMT family transporter n=1 Tax=Aeromicrobium fastidiosum TaxID=52699 RepID=A0A641ATI7_9ACTN|nr:DMT family transporter [Aeromicrobium fastidiosum]KAA1380827.1 DMT family transporter [Aeromicrobium fastidiosum]MBP2390453.1 putative membrane protein [Aeromicrobium fastidiosum]